MIIWTPCFCPREPMLDNPTCVLQSLPILINNESDFSTPNDVLANNSLVGSSTCFGRGKEGAQEPTVCLPNSREVCAAQRSLKTIDPNMEPPSEPSPKKILDFVEERVLIDSGRNQVCRGKSGTFQRHFSVPLPYRKEFSYLKEQPVVTDSNQINTIGGINAFGSTGDRPNDVNSGQNATCCHVSVPLQNDLRNNNVNPDQKENCCPVCEQKAQRTNNVNPDQKRTKSLFPLPLHNDLRPTEKDLKENSINSGDVLRKSNTHKPKNVNLPQNEPFANRAVSIPLSSQVGTTEHMKRQNNALRPGTGVDQSTSTEPTDTSEDQNGTSLGRALPPNEDDASRRHRKRFWSDPRRRRRPSKLKPKPNDKANLSNDESSLDDARTLALTRRTFAVRSKNRGFTKLKKRFNFHNPSYHEEKFGKRRTSRSSIAVNDIDNELGLQAVSCDESRESSIAAWVADERNDPPSSPEVHPSLKRSKSAPSKTRRRRSVTTRSSDKLSIPTADTREKVLHRLLATMLTTSGDDTAYTYPDIDNTDEDDVPKMEVEPLPSGNYTMHISMRLTSDELENFRSRRATNVKKSEFKKYLDSLSSTRI